MMNINQLSKILEKMYNKLGNNYLINNFKIEPFDFKVKVRELSRHEDLYYFYEYVVEITTDRPIPKRFEYKDELKKIRNVDGIHISVLGAEFKKYLKYIDTTFDTPGKRFGVIFKNEK